MKKIITVALMALIGISGIGGGYMLSQSHKETPRTQVVKIETPAPAPKQETTPAPITTPAPAPKQVIKTHKKEVAAKINKTPVNTNPAYEAGYELGLKVKRELQEEGKL